MIVMSEVGGSNIENPRSLLKSFETDIVVSVCGEDVVIFGDSSFKWTVLQRITAFGGIERGIPTVDPKGDQ